MYSNASDCLVGILAGLFKTCQTRCWPGRVQSSNVPVLFYTVKIAPVSSSLAGWAWLQGGLHSQLPSHQSRRAGRVKSALLRTHLSRLQHYSFAHSSAQGKGMALQAQRHELKLCLSLVSIRSATTRLSPPATPSPGTLFSGKVMC